jgi:nucleotide-binding universal stress UspA family protein
MDSDAHNATGARIVVVGSRGHHGFAGFLLGSVSLHCATHATCPLVVIPSAGGRDPHPGG